MKFKPGESGNPKGRPKKAEALTEILRTQLAKAKIQYPDGSQLVAKEALAAKLIELAMEGDVPALKYIYDRIDGKPAQSIDLDHSGELKYSIIPAVIPDDDD